MTTPMTNAGYDFFEHTADVGMRIYGASLRELFAHAAKGLTALWVDSSPIASSETRPVTLTAGSVEELFRAWLKELLFWFATDRFLPAEVAFETVTPTQLIGRVSGERFDPTRHAAGTEVKGLTYHQFGITQIANGWEARVIVDV